MGNFFSYARISTKAKDGKQSFRRQEKAFIRYEKENEIEFLHNYKDDCTGSTFNRKSWKKLERIIQDGDTIVFKEISRFTREAETGYSKYLKLMKDGINLVFLDNPTISTDYIKNLSDVANTQNLVTKTALEGTIKLLLIVELDRVEQERKRIVKRIKQGIEASDKKQGRKKGSILKLTDQLRQDIINWNPSTTQKSLMEKHNICRNTLKKYIKIVIN